MSTTDVSPYLVAADATWDEGPEAGRWIAKRLGPVGETVGHAVPLGYPAYATVPLPREGDPQADLGWPPVLDALLDVLERFTGDQPVHCGMWEGWSWWYRPGEDPRTAPGMAAKIGWSGTHRPPQEEMDRALAQARERMASTRVQQPDVDPLELPHRRYYLWTGPLRSTTAFRHQPHNPPSLIWPEDRAWFAGAPIYTNELAIAGTSALIDALLTDAQLHAHRATPDDVLDIDD
jgi:hypothetical protein